MNLTHTVQPPTTSKYQMCSKTVMDTSDPDITFDEHGICNHWYEYHRYMQSLPSASEREQRLANTITRI